MNESRLFYISYGFGHFNSVLLPLIVEASILLLAIEKDHVSRIVMVCLIIYNVISFSFFSISVYEKKASYITSAESTHTVSKSEKARLTAELETVKKELLSVRSLYGDAVKNKYITKANTTYLPRLDLLEKREQSLSKKIGSLSGKISETSAVKSKNVLMVGTCALIFLKIILQIVSILFLGRLKRYAENNRQERRI